MAGFIEESFLYLHSLGFFTVVLPFLLIYVITFGLLMRVKLFKRKDSDSHTQYNSVLAFCLAFFTINAVDITENLPVFIGLISFLFIGILVINILLGMLGSNKVLQEGKGRTIYIWFVSLYLLFAVIQVFFEWDTVFDFISKSGVISLIPVVIFLVVFLGIVYWVTKEDKSPTNKSSSKSSKRHNSSMPLQRGTRDELRKLHDLDEDNVEISGGRINSSDNAGKDHHFYRPE